MIWAGSLHPAAAKAVIVLAQADALADVRVSRAVAARDARVGAPAALVSQANFLSYLNLKNAASKRRFFIDQ